MVPRSNVYFDAGVENDRQTDRQREEEKRVSSV